MVINNVAGNNANPYAQKKVDGQRQADQAQQAQRTQESAKTSGQNADRVALSSEARLRGAALQTANEAADVRREKVDRLKQQVQDGTYQPDLKKAAANLIRDDLNLLTER